MAPAYATNPLMGTDLPSFSGPRFGRRGRSQYVCSFFPFRGCNVLAAFDEPLCFCVPSPTHRNNRDSPRDAFALVLEGGGPSEPIPESPMAIRRHGLRLDVCENFGVCRPLDFWLVPVGDAFSPGGVVFWAGSFQEVDSPVCHGYSFGGFFLHLP